MRYSRSYDQSMDFFPGITLIFKYSFQIDFDSLVGGSPGRYRSSSVDIQNSNHPRLPSPMDSPHRLRSMSGFGFKQSSFIHLLPDPACCINIKGQIRYMNISFEKIFKEMVPHSIHIFDYMEANIVDEAKNFIQEVDTWNFYAVLTWRSFRYHKPSFLLWGRFLRHRCLQWRSRLSGR